MHYKANGYTIRAENAAKPAKQASGYVVDLLHEYGPFSSALDFGCGKLRYAVHLQRLSKRLTIVDSEIQLSRTQILCDETGTVRAYVSRNWSNVRAVDERTFSLLRSRHDFILCANVLSTMPAQRMRISIVRLLGQRLTARGRCLFICQYGDKYFRDQMNDPTVTKLTDGFLKGEPGNASFYGLIKLEPLQKLVRGAGMSVERAWNHKESAFVVGTRAVFRNRRSNG